MGQEAAFVMNPLARLDQVAARLGRPGLWGSIVARIIGFTFAIMGAGFLLAASLAPTVSVASAAVETVSRDLLTFDPLPPSIGEPQERSVVRARNGRLLAVLHDVENRKLVPLSDVPEHVRDAVTATEDADFFSHQGVDWTAIARAAVGNYRAGEVRSGASTITQQLVKLAVTQDRSVTYDRKLREAYYASQLERQLTKDQILGEYLNLAYFGNGIYGIGTAAEYYFDKRVGRLTLTEGALLAGMIRAPEINDPIDRPDDALGRRNIVLAQMGNQGLLTAAEVADAQASPLGLNLADAPPKGRNFFVTYVTELLKREPALGATRQERAEAILRGGLTIKTTLDPRLQRSARRAITDVLPDLDGPQAAVTALDPRSGEILAIGVGPKTFGRGKNQSQVTPAVRGLGSPAGRQPGSAFKAFQLVAALEDGISPAYTFEAGARYEFTQQTCNPPDYSPGNYADASQGLLNMAEATAKSSNTYFAHLEDLTGPERLTEVATRMGVTVPLNAFCSTVLGTEEVFGLDMAAGYGTLANNGGHCRPYAITEVLDRHGRTLLRNTPTCTPAVEPGIAATATDLLRGPIEGGTATRNGNIGRPAAGKTGTTDNYGNAWFIGFVPQLVASTWVGHPAETKTLYDSRCSGGRVTGGCLPTMIWANFMKAAIKDLDLPVRNFPKPPPLPKSEIPNVVGRQVAAANRILLDAQFRARQRPVSSHVPAGTVLRQRPRAGSVAELGSAVILFVSDGTGPAPTLPNLIGLTEQDASNLLASLRLLGRAVDVPVSDPSYYGRVVGQRPAAGTPLDQVGEVIVEMGAPPAQDSGGGSGGTGPSGGGGGQEPADEPPGQGRGRGQGRNR
jgi:membrane peptidoglycan carboxypeptidase